MSEPRSRWAVKLSSEATVAFWRVSVIIMMMGVTALVLGLAARCWRMLERKERSAVDALMNVVGNSSRSIILFLLLSGSELGHACVG